MTTNNLEDSLAGLYKNVPHLQANGRKILVQWVPWINLVIGLLSLWAAWSLWHWAHWVNNVINYFGVYGTSNVVHRLSVGIWLGLIVLIVEAVMLLAAFAQTRGHKKSGWDLMFYVALLNVVYAIVLMFTDYGGVGQLIVDAIGSAIGLYFLFEIRSYYKAQPAKSPAAK